MFSSKASTVFSHTKRRYSERAKYVSSQEMGKTVAATGCFPAISSTQILQRRRISERGISQVFICYCAMLGCGVERVGKNIATYFLFVSFRTAVVFKRLF